MVQILTYLIVAASIFLVVHAPWFAALAYSTVSLLQPQYVWFWVFQDFKIFKITAGITIIGWGVMLLRGLIPWKVYKSGIVFGVVFLLAWYHLSYFFTPFKDYFAGVGSDLVMSNYFIIVVMFIVCLPILAKRERLDYAGWVVIGVTLYFAYWANMAYLQAEWFRFYQGRLNGPSGSPYHDGNAFAVVFVVGLPFVLFYAFKMKKKWMAWSLFATIPFIWHAIALTGSRGALLSCGVSTLFAAAMLRSKGLNIALVVGFTLFIFDQGGEMLQRSLTTVRMAQSNSEEPLNPRLVSWQVGTQLIAKYPVFGVGPQRFQIASAFHFPGKSPHVAHNTLLNFSTNIGLPAGIVYLSFFWIAYRAYKRMRAKLLLDGDKLLSCLNNSIMCSLVGFFVSAVFLDLIIFEPFYFVLLLSCALKYVYYTSTKDSSSAEIGRIKTLGGNR